MKKMKYLLYLFLFCSARLHGQQDATAFIHQQFEKGHFNGAVLIADQHQTILDIQKGYANFQFSVPVTHHTKFPVASVTKLFTTIALLQLYEKQLLQFSDPVGKYIDYLNDSCKNVTISELLLHYSPLENEPIRAYTSKFKLDDYIKTFVKNSTRGNRKFNYNNVDYVLLSKVIEKITRLSYAKAIDSLILQPLQLTNTGFVEEGEVIAQLAYGYHNYTFGTGSKTDKLYNDRRYLSNYYGAGQIYSTTYDLHRLLLAIKNNQLITEKTKQLYMVKSQTNDYIDWLKGKPTYGFFYDDKHLQRALLRRSGSIDGFNSEIIISADFSYWVIILCNTDTGDLKLIGKRLVETFNK
ncbi:serine hydrolase domain-containing protein [Gynurincola endophyticus]|uniref:serine hydrolase domain-containing protein n=1 Tax=Gynurincola endophyticus TaxID=2479004 RepID=UPI000F8F3B5A|nr:serine hydrolase domain-containing protein [Gynurincola endophyticus]